jgi:hypothetical protein
LKLPGLALLLLLFPDGRLPSRRWRIVPWLLGTAVAGITIWTMLHPAGGRRGDPALPALRHRPAHQPHPRLWAANCAARAGLCRRIAVIRPGHRRQLGSAELAGRRATLAAAVVFHPARRRIQAVVDRRFNRRRHNAAQTIEAFSARLRDQVDLDSLAAELLTVVDQRMRPTRTSLWLRQSAKAP